MSPKYPRTAHLPPCHEKAEVFHSTGVAEPEFGPSDLYRLIGSTEEKARAASLRL